MKITEPDYNQSQYEPRDWQRGAIEAALDQIQGAGRARGIVHAVMGAGKSYVAGAICNAVDLDDDETIVVTTVKQQLVTQLVETLRTWCGMAAVGRYDGKGKRPDCDIVVTCLPSAEKLARALARRRKEVPLWIADEAHRTECETVHEAAQALDPEHAIGFTATPYRADEDERLSLWSDLVYEYTAAEAMRDGVVVPYTVEHWTGGDAETVDQACIEMIQKHALDLGPGMVNAPQTNNPEIGSHIDDAEQFAAKCRDAGMYARAIHSRNRDRRNDQLVRRLRDGDLNLLVHVNLLSEGVDLPWIRWLCLRRPIVSPVRFAQEVGRVLRSHEGKEEALLLDPHDLLATHSLGAEAILGGGQARPEAFDEGAAEEMLDELDDRLEEITPLGDHQEVLDPHAVPIEALPDTSSFLRKTRLGFSQNGLCDPEVTSTHWRDKAPTDAQCNYLEQLVQSTSHTIKGTAPDSVRNALRCCWRAYDAGEMGRGDISDWIEILQSVQNHGRWPDREIAVQ